MILRYKGIREFMLYRKEPGFGSNQYVWIFDVFKYHELMQHFKDGWVIHDEDKQIEAFNRTTA
ncbi:hypothetical protein [Bacillus pseudomycoides]|uniref:hypothetical protein n=1 Tax=Bacillus pseudomycoides TaxID=64104 RepID=UPI000BF05099|nr:hypothetical protein [Bacillus pseudomycoides]PEJ40010.1 hypothetical protein CN677_01760 [Bacillus pseudomycoides]PHA94502.1 hypothetical protein COE78_12935 [Bacillus pseudomycoides]PHC71189.1 hypothetical protein COF38_23870 [Bacillus pseudomycoides]